MTQIECFVFFVTFILKEITLMSKRNQQHIVGLETNKNN